MKNFVAKLAIMILALNGVMGAMEKPLSEKHKGVLSKVKNIFSSTLTPEQATLKVIELLNSKKEITLSRVQELMIAGADINATNAQGDTLLSRVVNQKLGQSLAKYLVENGARVSNSKVLLEAARLDRLPQVMLLLKAGADANVKDNGGIGALYYAIDNRNYDMVKALLAADADVNTYTVGRSDPLSLAFGKISQSAIYDDKAKSLSIIELLIANGAIVAPSDLQKVPENAEKLKKLIESNLQKKKLE